ncbi:MAG: hypothetical protein II920_02810 [Clostridia bacterium]|nr:hypothetical protein [Clostridia bacterium]
MQVTGSQFIEWSMPVFGYYRCSRCRSINTFTIKLFDSSIGNASKVRSETNDREYKKLNKRRQKLMSNAKKGIYFMPYTFSGSCIKCGKKEKWQRTMNRPLGVMEYVLPPILVLLSFITGIKLWKLAVSAGVWCVIKLALFLIAKAASDECWDMEAESRPHFYETEYELNDALKSAHPGKEYLENKKIYGASFW